MEKKKPTAAKKTTSAKKSNATKKTSVANKFTTAKKTAVKRTTTTKKSTTSRKHSTNRTSVTKNPEVTVEQVVEVLTKHEEEKKIEQPKSIEKEIVIETLTETKTEQPKKKIKVRPIVKILCLLVILALACFFVMRLFCKKESYKDKATYTTSFFIKNNKGKYALFSENGKKITDFIYDSVGSFINDTVLVYKEKEGYAIINKKAKEIVSFGTYNYMSSYAGLYKVRSDKGYKLLDTKGKTIVDADEVDINSYGDDYPFNVVKANKEIKVISYDGKTITSFKLNKEAKSPTVNHISEYASIFYDGKNVIFNSKTKKVIAEFKKNIHYCVNNVSENGNIITLTSCTSWFETLTESGNIISVKGNINDVSKECNSLSLLGDTIICSSSNGDYFVNIKGKKASIGAKINSRVAFIDERNYVVKDNENNKLVFYKKGKKVKTMDASLSSIGKMNNDLYVLYVDKGYEYYNKDGKKAINENYKYAYSFDKNNLARVSKDGNVYYLINEKGKKISDEYSLINIYENYYQVTNKKGLRGIINKKGKEVLSPKYTNISIRVIRDKYYAITNIDGGKYALYNLDNGKLIIESKDSITINDHYIKTSGEKISYYTFKGKLIYKE